MLLTEKEMSVLKDLQTQEKSCIEKYGKYAQQARDPELVYKAIRGGLAGSTVMDAKAPMMLDGNYKPGFRIELHIKDLNNALNAAHAI